MKDGTQQLPDSSRDALIHIADMLRRGFSGTLLIEAHEGGVRAIEEKTTWRPRRDRAK